MELLVKILLIISSILKLIMLIMISLSFYNSHNRNYQDIYLFNAILVSIPTSICWIFIYKYSKHNDQNQHQVIPIISV